MPEESSKAKKFDELGVSGLARSSGWRGTVMEEILPELSGVRAFKAFREMRENDSTVGAVLFAIEMLIRQVEWRVEGEDEEAVQFVESCMQDMSHTWGHFLTEVLSFLTYGFSWHEIVYKRRLGDSNDPTKRSRFSDGKIGWRKLPIRSQDSLQEWVFDDDGGVSAFVQLAPPEYKTVEIPLERSLLFRIGSHKNNPEGRSLLRSAYRSWMYKKRIEEVEGIGIERDLAGLPVIYRGGGLEKYDEEYKRILRNVRRDEQEGLLLPLAYDEQGRKLVELTLLSSPGKRQLDISQVIDRYDKRISMTCLADFILLGQQAVGSFALADSKTDLFALACSAVLGSIADPMNLYAIPRLLALNGIKVVDGKSPQLVPGDLEAPDLAKLGSFITSLAGAGMPLFPDDDLENHLRGLANLPAKSEQSLAVAAPKETPPVSKPPKEKEQVDDEEEE